MQRTDGRIRLRQLGDSGQKVLTYKKPLQPIDGAKREIEHEILFEDKTNQIEKILEFMDFHPTTSYERYRSEWKIGRISIALDEYPFANFVEIEGDSEDIKELAGKLNFDINKALTKPCDTLFRDWRRDRSLSFKAHMRFGDYDK
jgi:adenylate cyclase class 2